MIRAQKSGVWNLDTPGELLAKLHSDLKRMKQEPSSPWPAYDFFVTAYHMHGRANAWPPFTFAARLPDTLWVTLADPSSTSLRRHEVGAIELGQCLIDHWTDVIKGVDD